jgi:hypothetical protein
MPANNFTFTIKEFHLSTAKEMEAKTLTTLNLEFLALKMEAVLWFSV